MKCGNVPVDNLAIGKDPQCNDDFDYGPREQSPRMQFLCPFAAHVRKTGPRTDIPKEDEEKRKIRRGGTPSSRFCSKLPTDKSILGITYGPELSDKESREHVTSQERGLSFVCYQSSVADGFEFMYVTHFHDYELSDN